MTDDALTFRAATASDLGFIVALIAMDDVSGVNPDDPASPDPPHYREALDAISSDPNQMLIVAELSGRAVGTCQLTFIPGLARKGMWRGLIEAVHIAPEHRNKGFGAQMMDWALQTCREHGCGMVQLTSNKKRVDAHRFYKQLGFVQSHEGFKYFL